MARKRNPYKRFKLRAHDQGINRHNKGVAYEQKAKRLTAEHQHNRSDRRRHK